MSRIGKKPIAVPSGVSVNIDGNTVKVKGPKGELLQKLTNGFQVTQEGNELSFERPSEQKSDKALHGLYRSLVNNMIIGVSQGYSKKLELVGVGYKANVQQNVLELNLGYSHAIFLALPPEIKVQAETQKGQNPIITLESSDKQLIGQIAAKIRSLRKIEPYKGKGVRFVGEVIRTKAGKTASK